MLALIPARYSLGCSGPVSEKLDSDLFFVDEEEEDEQSEGLSKLSCLDLILVILNSNA